MEYGFSPILLDREICRDPERSTTLEWIDTNNTGGYAMGTVAGINTRRYHALLAAALDPPFERYVIVSGAKERVQFDDQEFDLSCHRFSGGRESNGYEFLTLFRLDPYPIWVWQLGDKVFTKRLILVKGKPTVVLQYTSSHACSVSVRLLLACRDYHDLMRENDAFDQTLEQGQNHFRIKPYAAIPALTVSFGDNARFQPGGEWEHNFEYTKELERGMSALEDLYSAGTITLNVRPDGLGWIVGTLEDEASRDERSLEKLDEQSLTDLAEQYRQKSAAGNSPFEARLTAAADHFRAVRRDDTPSLMAGWPWFAAWGRDSMISLPGLLITRGLFDEARGVIEGFLRHLNQGLIPNYYPDVGPPEYNSIDATLWMFQAVWSLVHCGGGLSWVKEVFYPAAKNIIRWHERGTIYEIKMDPEDGLLCGGSDGTMLTWMDAKVGDWVVTPRRGKPVEVNALWYNALRMMLHWAADFEDGQYAHTLRDLAKRAQHSFREKFWNAERRCLYDVVDSPDGIDAKLRPNQIFAVSLPFPLLDESQCKDTVNIVQAELLTPVGLRSLERGDPDYRPRYEGDRRQRDAAYHNGTVWPWLIGPFITAYLRAFGKSSETVAYCRDLVDAFEPLMLNYGLGSVAEIFDGDEPHLPRGCISQAWSVAELLRVLRSDLA